MIIEPRKSILTMSARSIVLGLSLLAASNSALAQDSASNYEMSIIAENPTQWANFTTGNYPAAIDFLNEREPRGAEKFITSNNLCAAYTLNQNFQSAASACDNAVAISKQLSRFRDKDDLLNYATALSNRGILRVVTGDRSGAKNDFDDAIGLHTELSEAYANRRHFENADVSVVADLSAGARVMPH